MRSDYFIVIYKFSIYLSNPIFCNSFFFVCVCLVIEFNIDYLTYIGLELNNSCFIMNYINSMKFSSLMSIVKNGTFK